LALTLTLTLALLLVNGGAGTVAVQAVGQRGLTPHGQQQKHGHYGEAEQQGDEPDVAPEPIPRTRWSSIYHLVPPVLPDELSSSAASSPPDLV
jgi:hypothetical protein